MISASKIELESVRGETTSTCMVTWDALLTWNFPTFAEPATPPSICEELPGTAEQSHVLLHTSMQLKALRLLGIYGVDVQLRSPSNMCSTYKKQRNTDADKADQSLKVLSFSATCVCRGCKLILSVNTCLTVHTKENGFLSGKIGASGATGNTHDNCCFWKFC